MFKITDLGVGAGNAGVDGGQEGGPAEGAGGPSQLIGSVGLKSRCKGRWREPGSPRFPVSPGLNAKAFLTPD